MGCSQDDRLERRRRSFVEVGRALFIEKGFERTTLAEVVERAGGSLSTLYKLFGGKAGLLTAVVEERSRSGRSLIVEIGESDLDPATALRRLGEEMRRNLLDPEGIAISRVVIAYSLEDPEFAADFYRKTLLESHEALAELFERWREKGIALRGEPKVMAAAFLGLFIYEFHSSAISHGTLSQWDFGNLEDKIAFFCRGAGLSG